MIRPGEMIKKNFFVIDSRHLEDVVTRFYGFSIDEENILNSNEDASVCSFVPRQQCGAWLYIERTEHEIVIHQDPQGAFGLYLFQANGYFAISNSFIMLVDYVKTKYPISMNREVANALLKSSIYSRFIKNTMVNEIVLVSRHERVHIDLKSKMISMERVNYNDFSVSVNSVEGLTVLDSWVAKWVNIIRRLKAQTNNLSVDLSGGMDSRVTFMLFLLARVNFLEIKVNSMLSKTHTVFEEDFTIASQIASQYDISLNQDVFSLEEIPLQLSDMIDHSVYLKLGFCKQLFFHYTYNMIPIYGFSGMGGECLRKTWHAIPSEIQTANSDINMLEAYYPDEILRKEFLVALYRETWDRVHFAKTCVEHFLGNVISAAPLMDAVVRTLSLSSDSCNDPNLLYAIMYTRYCPKLLDIPFDKGRVLDERLVSYAKKINDIKPFANNYAKLPVQSRKADYAEPVAFSAINPSEKPIYSILSCLRKSFDSDMCKDIFLSEFPASIYNEAGRFADESKFYPLQQVYMVLAVTKILQDVRLSQKIALSTPFSYFSAMCDE